MNSTKARREKANSRTPRAHVFEESDGGIVPMNHSNKDGKRSAESEEGRPLIKENTHQPSTYSTQSEARVSQRLAGVRKVARERKGTKFTALLRHLTVGPLRESFFALKRKAAPRRWTPGAGSSRGATSLWCAMRTTMCSGSNTGPKQTDSWRNSGNGWQSSDLDCTQKRRARLSSGDSPNKTGNEGEGKPETFDFLGFTHICTKNRNGNYVIKRHTIGKHLRAKLAEIKLQLRQRMHEPVAQTGKWLKPVVQGYFNYYADRVTPTVSACSARG